MSNFHNFAPRTTRGILLSTVSAIALTAGLNGPTGPGGGGSSTKPEAQCAAGMVAASIDSTLEDQNFTTDDNEPPKAPSVGQVRDTVSIKPLLKYIQRYESAGAVKSQGAASAYDVVYGGIAPKHRPSMRLTSMTVGSVLEWQDAIDPLYPSEAAGALQVMEDTLRGLVNAGLIVPDEIFDEATQDKVAELLIARRGLLKFIAGEISAEDFADSLAKEWAGLPVVRDQQGASRFIRRGQSYYAGDGMNKAHADPDEFLAIISGLLTTS